MKDKLSEYYEKAFAQAGEGGSIYSPMTILERAGHDRKGYLLSRLPLPDLRDATVLDYGVGSWGFGCVFPRLKECKIAIGVDISSYAVDCSRNISASDPMLSGKDLRFFTSSGYDIKIDDSTVDLVFAGECIEHIEDTDLFLAEIWRILKIDGVAVFTTPNEKPFFYKKNGLKWAMGFEHVALMESRGLIDRLEKYFTVEVLKGYTSTITPDVDELVDDVRLANSIAELCEDAFHDASGLIVQVRKSSNIIPLIPKGQVEHIIVESESAQGFPGHRDLSLYENTNGRMPVGDQAHLSIPIPRGAVRCQLILWSHPWSGICLIETSKTTKEIDLYSHVSGCTRVSFDERDLVDCLEIKLCGTEKRNQRSRGAELIFFRAVFACLTNHAT